MTSLQIPTHTASSGRDADEFTTFIASGRDVSAISIHGGGTSLGERGKGGVYLPHPAVDPLPCTPIPGFSLRTEIQSLTFSNTTRSSSSSTSACVLAATDSYGRAVLAHLHMSPSSLSDNNDDDSSSVPPPPYQVMGLDQFTPANLAVEAGWTGIAIAPGQPSQTAIARHFPKDVTLFDGPMAVRTIHTLYRPYAVQLLSSQVSADPGGGPLIAVAEGPAVSVWDVRAAGRGARIARLCPSPLAGHFYCLAATGDDGGGGGGGGAISSTSSSGGGGPPLLGAAGADRSVQVWDPRMWRVIDRWTNCLKYEATSLSFLSTDSNYCVVGGMDYEVVCGRWGGDRRNRLGGGHRSTAASIDGGGGNEKDSIAVGDDKNIGVNSVSKAVGRAVGPGEDEGKVRPGNVSFRGDTRWMGVVKASGRDVVAGLTASKHLYIAEFGTVL